MKVFQTFLLTCLLTSVSSTLLSAQEITYRSYGAEIYDYRIVNGETASAVDAENNVHVAWVFDNEEERYLKYWKIRDGEITDNSSIRTSDDVVIAPDIAIDDEGIPHIVFFAKRDKDGRTRNGNNAVYYATDSDTDGNFEIDQVSTNSTDPENTDDNIFNSYVNDSPKISFYGNNPVVTYTGDPSGLTSYDSHVILAYKNGDSWNRVQTVNLDEQTAGSPSAEAAVSVPRKIGEQFHIAWHDISDYQPVFVYGGSETWSESLIPGYNGTFANNDVQLHLDGDDNVHMFFFNEAKDPEVWVHSELDANGYTVKEEVPAPNSPGGNFFPVAIDPVTNNIYYFHSRSFSDTSYLIKAEEKEGSTLYEAIELEDIGNIYGQASLHARNNIVTIVTASDSKNIIHLTTVDFDNRISNETFVDRAVSITLGQNYPNPFNPATSINYELPEPAEVRLQVFDMLGRMVATLVDESKSAGMHTASFDASTLSSGMYIYQFTAGDFMETKKMSLVK